MNKVLIKNIAQIKNGSTPSTKREDFYNGNIVWITPKDLSNQKSKYIYSGEKKLTELGYNSCSTSFIPKGSILLSSRAPIGLLAIAGTKLCTNQGFKNFVLDSDKIFNEYLFYWLKTRVDYISNLGTGTTFKEVSKNVIENLEINLPSLKYQKQIAKVLSDLDAKIEVNNKINQELEAMAKTLYDYWFVQFDFPDKNGKPYKSSGGKMVFNEVLKREIPEGWEDGVLSDIANITMGQSPSGTSYNEDGIGAVFYQGSTDFGSRFPTVRKYTIEPNRMAEENDILLSVRAPVGTLNQAMEKCCIGRGLAALREKEGSISFLWSQMEYFKQIFDRRNASGTTFGSITKDDLFGLKLCIPDKEVLEKFKIIADPFHEKIVINSKENQKLSELRDWLLPMLMNGQVSVGGVEKKVEGLGLVAESGEE